MHRSSLAGASGPARLQTGATFNDLLVNCPPDTCKNKAGVRGVGAVSRVPARAPCPGGARPGVPPHPAGSGWAGAAGGGPGRAGPGCWGRIRMRIRPSRCGRSPGHKGLFLRALTGTFFKGLEAITRWFFFFFFSSSTADTSFCPCPPTSTLISSCFCHKTPRPRPPFPLR